MCRCLFAGALYASSSNVAVDGNSIFANNFALIDGGEERLLVMSGIRASRRLEFVTKITIHSYEKIPMKILLQLIFNKYRPWSKSGSLCR